MRKFGGILAGLCFWALPGLAANNPYQPLAVPSIAVLTSGVTDPGQHPVVSLISYVAGNNKGGGTFHWNPADTEAANACTVFAISGVATGRWRRQLEGPLDASMCGVTANGSTDDAAAFRAAFAVAAINPLQTLTVPCGHIVVNSTVTATQGVSARGCGMGTTGGSPIGQTFIDGSGMASGWVFDITTPNGTNQFEAPKYYDMSITASQAGGDPVGGCIRWNSVSGGFTDGADSQYYMVHPHAERINCLTNNGVSNQMIGIQCNKCFDGDISQSVVFFGKYGIDLEGSDIVSIGGAGPNRVQGTVNCLILLTMHGTFGNKNRVVHNELLYPADFGQSYPGYVCDNSESGVIEANHIEGVIANAVSGITIGAGFNHVVRDNDIDVIFATNWLQVTVDITSLTVEANGCAGCGLGAASFPAGGTKYYYNAGGVRQVITHSGNATSGDAGFPFNSVASSSDSLQLSPNSDQYFSCNTDGLDGTANGFTAKCLNGVFQMTATGTGAVWVFGNTDRPTIKGTLNLKVQASSASGGQLCGQFLDAGVPVGSYTCQTLTASLLWYTIKSGSVISTAAAAAVYPTTADVKLGAVEMDN